MFDPKIALEQAKGIQKTTKFDPNRALMDTAQKFGGSVDMSRPYGAYTKTRREPVMPKPQPTFPTAPQIKRPSFDRFGREDI